jgi:tRNA G18 (ribose-2'-O)-methylase SpoU
VDNHLSHIESAKGHPLKTEENFNSNWPRVVADYRRALSVTGRQQLGLFAIEGFRLLERAIACGTPLAHVLVCQSDFDTPTPRLLALLGRVGELDSPLTLVPDNVLGELTEGRTFGAVLALAAIRQPPELAELLAAWEQSPARRKLLVLEELMDPGNVGALMRTAHALGVEAVVALRGTDPLHPRSARTSMGSVFRVPVIRWESTETLLALLRKHGVLTIGAATEACVLLPEARFESKAMALFVGNEGKGISPGLRDSLDQLVAIPMGDAIDSFSVNAATAVILYAMTYGAK